VRTSRRFRCRTSNCSIVAGLWAQMQIVDCVTTCDSSWFFGPYGFLVLNGKALPFRPCKGALGFFVPEGGYEW